MATNPFAKYLTTGTTATPTNPFSNYLNPSWKPPVSTVKKPSPTPTKSVAPKKLVVTPTPPLTGIKKVQQTGTDIFTSGQNVVKKIGNDLQIRFVKATDPTGKLADIKKLEKKPLVIKPNQTKLTSIQLKQLNGVENTSATPTSKTRTANAPQNLAKQFPETIKQTKKLFTEPVLKKDFNLKQTQTENRKIAQQAWNDTKTSFADYYTKGIQSEQKGIPVGEKIIRKAETAVAGGKTALTAISGVFQLLGTVPVVGKAVEALSIPFVALEESGVSKKVSSELIKSLPVSNIVKKRITPVVTDGINLATQIALGHFLNIGTKKALGVTKQAGSGAFEKLTKNIIDESGSARTVNLSPAEVRAINLGKPHYEAQMVKELGLTSGQWRDAVQNGLKIEIPAEKIARIVDKPYWEKVKKVFKVESTANKVKTPAGKPQAKGSFGGYLEGEKTPQQVIGEVISKGQENTPQGKQLIKSAVEAKNAGQNIMIEKPSSPLLSEASITDPFYEYNNKSLKVFDTDEFVGKASFKEAVNNIGGPDYVKRGTVDLSKLRPTEEVSLTGERGKRVLEEVKSGLRIPIVVDEFNGHLDIMDGNHRYFAYKQLGIKDIPIIINKGYAIPVSKSSVVPKVNPLVAEASKYKSAVEVTDKPYNFKYTSDEMPTTGKTITYQGKEVGGIGYGKDLNQTDAWLSNIEIDPKYRNKGVGKKAMEQFFETSGETKVNGYAESPEAAKFFKSIGAKVDADGNFSLSKSDLYNKSKGVQSADEEIQSLLDSDMAKEAEAEIQKPKVDKAKATIQNIQEDIQMRRQDNEAKKSILEQFTGDQIKAMRTIKQSMESRENKGKDAITVEETQSYKDNIADVMSVIGTNSTDEALRFIREDLPSPLVNASTRAELEQIKVLKSHITPKEATAPKAQLPVGEGKLKASKLEARVKGVMGKVTQEQIDDLGVSTYQEMNKKETIAKAAEYVTQNPEEALDVIRGKIEAPKDLIPEAIYIALTEHAVGDLTLGTKLASLQATALGQRISILSELNKDSAVKILNEVYKIRAEEFKKTHSGKSVKEVVRAYTNRAKIEPPKLSDWGSLIKEVRC